MNTKDRFLKSWFDGVDTYLQNSADSAELMRSCARGCSDSYSRQLYEHAFRETEDDIPRALAYIKKKMDDFDYRIEDDGIEIIYSECGCDLVTEGLITSPAICDCSRESLLYNWETLFGVGNVKVIPLETVLRGGAACRFKVRLKQLEHF